MIDYARADGVIADPLADDPAAGSFLPRVPDSAGWRDVVRELHVWVEIPAGELDSGDGPRFSVDTASTDASHHRL